jgi:PPOX class probable F420-dependent enzyme
MTVTQQHMRPDRPTVGIPGKYLSLTTYRRDGTPVSTPVWFVEDAGRLYVTTAAGSYKARRLRRNPAAMVGPCTARGAPRGEAIPARVEFLPAAEHDRVDGLLARKYRVDRILILPVYRLAMWLRGKRGGPVDTPAYLEITPT